MDEVLNLNLEFDERIGYFVSSRTIAEGLKRNHKDVLESLDNILNNSRADISALFIKGSYKASNGKTNREYKLTKDGFTLYMFHVQGFTEFKMAYINRFNEMESFIKESHAKLKEIKIDKKFDWMTKRGRDRFDRTEYIEDMIAYLFERLKKEYEKLEEDVKFKKDSITRLFYDFKTPEKYDVTKEPLPVIVELEIEKENLDKINELGLDKDKVLENTVKILGQQKLSNKE